MKPYSSINHAIIRVSVVLLVLAAWSNFHFENVSAAATLVDIATDATDPFDMDDSEPSIAVNPANPLEIAVVAFSGNSGPGVMAPVWKSTNGGATWRKVPQLPSPPSGLPVPFDQKVAYDSTGRLYVVQLAANPPSFSIIQDYIYRQTAGTDAPLTPGALYGDDQPHLDIDKTAGSPFLNRIYSPWLNTGLANWRSMVTNSATGGVGVTNVGAGNNSSFSNRTTRIAVAPNGSAYIIYKTHPEPGAAPSGFENAHFRVNRSDDGGANWNAVGGAAGVSIHGPGAVQTWFTTSWGNPAKGKTGRARSSDAWIAADPSDGDIYAAYVSRDVSGFGQIYVARSTNQGGTWTSTRVTDGTHHSAYPEIAVAANGVVGVLYMDFDDSGAHTIFRHRFARSFNDGTGWDNQILQSFDPEPFANASDGAMWWDYNGLTANGNTFYGVFCGASIGRTNPQLDPIFFRETAMLPGHIEVPGSVAFGTVCAGSIGRTTLNVCNTGGGPLSVSAISSSNPARFAVTTPSGGFPIVINPGSCFPFEVTFTPAGIGPQTATLTISSDDPSTPSANVPATAQSGAGALGLSPDLQFPPTVIQSIGPCQSSKAFVVSNTGTCNLTITNIAIAGANPGDYSLSGLPAFPVTLEPGHVVGQGALNVVFAPTVLARERTANITVTFVSDPGTGATSNQVRQLCGEGVRTGARVLVTQGGVPMPQVHEIELKRLRGGLFGFDKEVDEVKNVPLQPVSATPGTSCPPFQFHREYGAASNQEQLRPGFYRLKVEAKIAGHEVRKKMYFNLGTCSFNGTIVVDF